MKFVQFFLYGFILFLFPVYSGAQHLSENSTMSLLIVDPMPDVVLSSFGHAALRVNDPEQDIDHVFNYGLFDQSLPVFVALAGVFKGDLQSEMWVVSFSDFLKQHQQDNRRMIEYGLNLLPEEKNLIWKSLINDAQEKNRNYVFDFFSKNCTTFPRDLITNNIGKTIVLPDYLGHRTYRQINTQYASIRPWFNFTLDLITGQNVDKKAPAFESLYVPQELEKAWLQSYILDEDGKHRALFATSDVVIQGIDRNRENISNVFTPLICSLILLILVLALSFLELKHHAFYKWLDFVLFGATGLFGILFYIFKFGLAHWYIFMDWMILWLHPFHLLVVVFMLVKPYGKALLAYHLVNVVLITFLISGVFFLPQQYNQAFLPLMACLWIRSIAAMLRRQ